MKDSTKYDNLRHSWTHESGKLPVPMTNDYLFKAINQENDAALKGLICSVLHRDPEQIRSLVVLNPSTLGETIEEKDYVLDVKVELNDNEVIDLEMQVVNYQDWPERSLQYLCRTFDSLHKGEDYLQSKTAIHIGILDFVLFKNESSLLDSYRLMNVRTHKVYTEKFQLYILCLPLSDRPSDEDRRCKADVWARFYKAETWEELKMLAREDEGVANAVETGYRLCSDERVLERMQAREDYFRRVRTEQARMKQLQEKNEQLQSVYDQLQDTNEQLQNTNEQLQSVYEQLQNTNEQLQEQYQQVQNENEQLKAAIKELQGKLAKSGQA